jgi:hypothetical protein
VALLDEVTQSEGIRVGVAAGESLVGHVEEGVVVAGLDGLADLLPLLLGRVDAGRVVGAGVQQDDALLRHGLDVGHHALDVEADGLGVIVAVLLGLEAGVREDGDVVGPGRSRDVDGLRAWVESREEVGANAQRAGTGDALRDGDAALLHGSRLGAIGELGRSLGEARDAGDASVLMVGAGLEQLLLGGSDRRQDVGLAGVIAVGADTQIDFLRVAVGLVRLRNAWEG